MIGQQAKNCCRDFASIAQKWQKKLATCQSKGNFAIVNAAGQLHRTGQMSFDKIFTFYCQPFLLLRMNRCQAEMPGRKKENTARKDGDGFERKVLENEEADDDCAGCDAAAGTDGAGVRPDQKSVV